MLDDKFLSQFLGQLVKIYQNRFGESQGHLNEFLFDHSITVNESALSALVEGRFNDNVSTGLESLFNELEARQYIEVQANGDYALTISGYTLGSRGTLMKGLDFLNANPGLAILISVVSLVVSILALIASANANS